MKRIPLGEAVMSVPRYGSLYIDQLWVSDSIRHQGIGTQLIEAAFQYGKNKDCTFATVNTRIGKRLVFIKKQG
jgi:GNAT superfamily N-acetyltransferase